MSHAGETVGRDVVEIPLPPRRQVYVRLEDLGNKRTILKPPTARTLKLTRAYTADGTNVGPARSEIASAEPAHPPALHAVAGEPQRTASTPAVVGSTVTSVSQSRARMTRPE